MPTYLSPGVYVEELDTGSRPIEGVGTAVAAFVGLAEKGPFNTPTLVTNWSQFVSIFGEFVEDTYLALSVFGYFQNGGGAAFIVRIGSGGTEQAAIAELSTGGESPLSAYKLTALQSGSVGNDIQVTVSDSEEEGAEEGSFRLSVRQGDTIENYDPVSPKRGRTNVATVVNAQSTLIRLEELSRNAVEAVARGTVTLAGGGEQVPATMNAGDYVGDSASRSGVGGLEAIDEVTMLCVPDLMSAHQKGLIDLEGVKAVQLAMIAHCELMGDRMAILDPLPDLNAQQVHEWRVNEAGYDSKFATLYWPWIKVFDPADGVVKPVPPSGHMAGVWANSDATRGVHKAPANEVVRGSVGVATVITRGEHDLLNPAGINCIRSFPGRGIRVWGARTLSSDPIWRYINVRRLYNYVESSLRGGTQWVVFEPNDKDLWERLNRTIRSFLYRVWLDGALFGETADQAFYVKCDDETNPSERIEAGQLVCEIGMAVVKPAEFVVFRLAQLPTGTAVTE
jgi:uncharacterized protein